MTTNTAPATQVAVLTGDPRVRRRGNSVSWEQRYYDLQGVRKSNSGKTAKEAIANAEATVALLNETQIAATSKSKITFEDFAKKYVEVRRSGSTGRLPIKKATVVTYESQLRCNVYPRIGNKFLVDITNHDIRDFIKDMLDDDRITRTGASKTLVVVKSVLQYAFDTDMIASIPGKAEKIQLNEKMKKIARDSLIPTHDEIVALDAAARACAMSNNDTVRNAYVRYFPLYLILRSTGCRISEALGLKWVDIADDFRSAKLRQKAERIKESRAPEHQTGDLKTKNSIRTVFFNDEAATALKALKEASEGNPAHAVYPFSTRSGKIMSYDNTRCKFWTPLIERAGVKHFGMHGLRHYFATTLILNRKGVEASKLLGHNSMSFTADQYGHLLEEAGMIEEIHKLVGGRERAESRGFGTGGGD